VKDPAQAIKDHLITGGVGIFLATAPQPPTGWRVAVAILPKEPDTIILVTSNGGRNPFPHLLINEPTVQIMIRGAKNGYVAARTKAQEVQARMTAMSSVTLLGDVYRSSNQMGDIAFLGEDDNTRPLFSLNFWFIVLPAAEAGEARIPIT
jgi:hypothetical protein